MNISRILTRIAAALILTACGSTRENVEREFYPGPDKTAKYAIGVDKQGRKEGMETWWHPNGNKKYEARNHAGMRDGAFTAWYPDGKVWYQGYEYRGKPESTLTYFYPTGNLKSQALFRDGIQLERKDYDANGRLIGSGTEDQAEGLSPDEAREAASAAERLRKTSLNLWAVRVRQTVESFWVLPKEFEKQRPYRAVAKIKVGRDGKILGVSWMEKSPSSAFNTLAQQTFKRIKRMPAFPPAIKDQTLEIQYEFISLGKPIPRKKLEARESPDSPEG
jgi:hypothetical protein